MMSQLADLSTLAAVMVMCWIPPKLPTAPAPVKLEYKFPEGQKLTYKTTSRVRQVLTFGGNNMESLKRETKVWSRSVGKRRQDLALPIEDKVHSLRVEYSLPPKTKVIFDTSEPGKKIDDPRLAFLGDEFKVQSEIAYTVVVDEKNKLKAIEGTEKLQEKAMRLDNPIAREEICNGITVEKFKTQFEQTLRGLPDIPARAGEPWERTETLDVDGRALTIRKKYEYGGTEKRGDKTLDKISCKVLQVKYDQPADTKLPLKVAKSDLKVDSSDGTVLFDREEGRLVSANERLRFKGNMTFSGAGLDQSGGIDLTIDTNTQLQPPAK